MTDSSDTPYRSPIADEFGAEYLERSEGRCVIRFPVLDKYKIPSGVLQGGMYAAFMDMAMASAVEGGVSTATLQINLMRPATEGYVIVTGEVVRRGRSVMYLEAEVRTEDGKLLARGNQTGMVVQPFRPAADPE
ncbi:MAG: PaaI family thioesterase [Dehalococcoidia bacterium]|nr:PaaI family thioesterase [Dehalococcoidia bacterium]